MLRLAGRRPRCREALRAAAGDAPRAADPGRRRRSRSRAASRSCCRPTTAPRSRARRRRARAREGLGARHGRDAPPAADAETRGLRSCRAAPARDPSRATARRARGTARSSRALTTPSSGSRSRSQTRRARRRLLLADRPAPYASARRSLRSSRTIAGRASVGGQSAERGRVVERTDRETPSAVRIVHRAAGPRRGNRFGGGRRQREPLPSGKPARRRRDDDLAREHGRERRPEAGDVGRRRTARRRESRENVARRSSSPMIPRATARLAPASPSAARYAAALPPKRTRHDAPLDREASGRRHAARARLDRAHDERGQRELAVAAYLASVATLDAVSGVVAVDAADAGRQVDLARSPVGVELLPEDRRRVAQARIARPQPDARGVGLVRVVRARVALRPAPRPHVREPSSRATCFDSERLPLRDARTSATAAAALPPTAPAPGLEADHEPDPDGGMPTARSFAADCAVASRGAAATRRPRPSRQMRFAFA